MRPCTTAMHRPVHRAVHKRCMAPCCPLFYGPPGAVRSFPNGKLQECLESGVWSEAVHARCITQHGDPTFAERALANGVTAHSADGEAIERNKATNKEPPTESAGPRSGSNKEPWSDCSLAGLREVPDCRDVLFRCGRPLVAALCCLTFTAAVFGGVRYGLCVTTWPVVAAPSARRFRLDGFAIYVE